MEEKNDQLAKISENQSKVAQELKIVMDLNEGIKD